MTKTVAYLQSGTGAKKYKVTVVKADGSKKTIQFGAKGYSDFTKHKDKERMKRYDARHKSRENWGKSGIDTAGFWAKWILWNKPSLSTSISSTARKFGISIKRGAPPKSSPARKKSTRKSRKRKSRSRKRKSRSRKRKSRSRKRKSRSRKRKSRSRKRKSRSRKRKSRSRKRKSRSRKRKSRSRKRKSRSRKRKSRSRKRKSRSRKRKNR